MGMRSLDRATRILLSALLGSDLSTPELRELSQALCTDSDYPRRLSRLIDSVLEAMEDRYIPKEPVPTYDPIREMDSLRDAARSLLRRKNIPKSQLVTTMKKLAPDMGPQLKLRKMSADNLLSSFFREISEDEARVFVNWLRSDWNQPFDAYLSGIMERGR
jgi:hypothetical protein